MIKNKKFKVNRYFRVQNNWIEKSIYYRSAVSRENLTRCTSLTVLTSIGVVILILFT